MKYTQKREKNTLTVTFKMDNTEWATFDMRAYEQNKGKYNVPGFRKGHVPKNVLENRYGKGLFFEDALYLCAQEYYNQFLDKNKKVEPVARPQIDDKSIKMDDKGVTFAVIVTVKPDVTLGEYKGLTIEKIPTQEVKPQDIDAELAQVRERNARFVEITDRPVQEGDQINLDYSGKVDGVAFAGGTAEKQTLVIGSHSFIEGFEEQLVGMNIGETKDINVTVALAVMSIILIEASTFRAQGGLKGFLKSFTKPMALLAPLNVMEIAIRPLSLCMRLFGNVLGAFVVMQLIEHVCAVIVPMVFSMYFDVFDGLIQAYVFVFLTSLFMAEGMEVEEEEKVPKLQRA